MRLEQADPKGLIREAYRIEGITDAECRSIFLDWALSLTEGTSVPLASKRLIAEYGADGHPMTPLLENGLAAPATGARRGGAGGRRRS